MAKYILAVGTLIIIIIAAGGSDNSDQSGSDHAAGRRSAAMSIQYANSRAAKKTLLSDKSAAVEYCRIYMHFLVADYMSDREKPQNLAVEVEDFLDSADISIRKTDLAVNLDDQLLFGDLYVVEIVLDRFINIPATPTVQCIFDNDGDKSIGFRLTYS